MEPENHLFILLLIPLFIGSAFFSGSEVALFSLDKKKIKNSAVLIPVVQKYLLRLLETPRRLLVTILIGNTFVNTMISIIGTIYTIQIAVWHNWNVGIAISVQIVIVTIVLLIFGEISPKVLSSRKPELVAKIVAIPLYWICVLLFPIAEIITETLKSAVKLTTFKNNRHALTDEEIHHLASVGHEQGTIDEDEQELIKSVVESKTTTVREIMVHRTDIFSVSEDISFEELLLKVQQSKYSRIPVYRDNLDEITGVIHTKDLLRYLDADNEQKLFDIADIIRKPLIVPESKLINDMMREFQQQKLHLAIVVDEYGGTSGLVTLEDIIEEVVGELRDELESSNTLFQKISENSYLVSGAASFKEFCEFFSFPNVGSDDDFDTLAGWVFTHTETIPKAGYSFRFDRFNFTIRDSVENKIQWVLIEIAG